MTRKEWLKTAIKKIQSGEPLEMRCLMSTPERIALGLCLGALSQDRIAHRQDTCSPECQAGTTKRRLKREAVALRECRVLRPRPD